MFWLAGIHLFGRTGANPWSQLVPSWTRRELRMPGSSPFLRMREHFKPVGSQDNHY